MSIEVRPAREDELRATVRALAEAGFGPHVGRLVTYPWTQPTATVLIAPGRMRRVNGAACCASFGTTGWIGALGVVPRARGRGVGGALAEAAVAWLRSRGAATALLYATDAGRPIYERIGFVAEGRTRAWRGTPARSTVVGPRSLRPDDRDALLDIDRAATGERRDAVLDAITSLRGLGCEHDGRLSGYMLHSPWGAGPAVVASRPDAGLDLLEAARGATQGRPILTLPDANAVGVQTLRGWGFSPINHAERMRLGPSPTWHPEQIFGMFNLFWG